jgi:hypothetical protein
VRVRNLNWGLTALLEGGWEAASSCGHAVY